MAGRPSVVCQLCALDDYLSFTSLPDSAWQVICSGSSHPPWTWIATAEAKTLDVGSGIAAELGVEDKLLQCLRNEGKYEEYGIVEYRFGVAHPKEYSELVDLYGHTALPGAHRYTASAFLARILGLLLEYGEVGSVWGPGTGF